MKNSSLLWALGAVLWWPLSRVEAAPAVKLCENGRAALPVMVPAGASERVDKAAGDLAAMLRRMSGAPFAVEKATGPFTAGSQGILVGPSTAFPFLKDAPQAGDPTRNEDYLLRSGEKSLILAGTTDLAVEHAVWDTLYRLGYRHFFPGQVWEVVPKSPTLSLTVDETEHPDYYSRRIWAGFGYLPENREKVSAWNLHNRATSGIALSTGHAYDGIISRNKEAFKAHPEYLTRPGETKFRVSNPGLRQLVVDDALREFAKNPDLQSVSLDPSDGGGWDGADNPDEKQFKSVTDRVITLANTVAEAVNKQYPGKFVGMYAYNEHSPPPTINVDPHVVVSIATSFIQGGFTIDELLEGWGKKAKILGIREYYSVNPWDRDMPGAARGGNLAYLARTISHFHESGARFMSAESSDNWGPNGLGYYFAARALWDVDEAKHLDEIRADFLQRAFGPAREPMKEFYGLIDGSNRPLPSSDLIGRMYRCLDRAMQVAPDEAVRARLRDLALYTRYVELYSDYVTTGGEERQQLFEGLMRFSWRIKDTQMIHTLGLWRDLDKRDKQVAKPQFVDYRTPAPKNPWKSDEGFTPEQVQAFIKNGIANNKLLEFEAKSFSTDLVPATALNLPKTATEGFKRLRGTNNLYTWIDKAPGAARVTVRTGLIFDNRGGATTRLFPSAETMGEAVAETETPADKEPHEVTLKTNFSGLHWLNVNDGSAGMELSWPEGTPFVIESSLERRARFTGGRWNMYFYVPKGTKAVGGYRTAAGRVVDGSGQTMMEFGAEGARDYWSVPVPPGQDGQLWKFENMNGLVCLMTVPPYLARSAAEMMVPAEVAKADAR